jgi:hypothetical protein
MLPLLYVLLATARSSLKAQRELALDNLALRQQLAIVQRKTKRPRLTQADRAFWVALCSLWPHWHNALIVVKPQAVIGVISAQDEFVGRALGHQALQRPGCAREEVCGDNLAVDGHAEYPVSVARSDHCFASTTA